MAAKGQRTRDERQIINVFVCDMPQTTRVLNAPAIVEEIVLGRDVTAEDEDKPPKEVYDRYQEVLDELVAAEVLQTGEYLGCVVYGLTVESQKRVLDQVVHFLEQRAVAEQERASRGDVPWKLAGERRGRLQDVVTLLKTPMEPGS
jgi:hypothetical protein